MIDVRENTKRVNPYHCQFIRKKEGTQLLESVTKNRNGLHTEKVAKQ